MPPYRFFFSDRSPVAMYHGPGQRDVKRIERVDLFDC